MHIDPANPKKCSKNQFKNPRWRTATILKNVKYDISTAVQPILMKFGTVMHLSPPNLIVNRKFKNFKIEDGGQRPSWKSKNRDISETVWLILTKFCMMTHIYPPEVSSWSKNETFKNARWRTAAILKIVKCDISATVWPILVKFDTAMYRPILGHPIEGQPKI